MSCPRPPGQPPCCLVTRMWPSTFHRKSATISGWQCLGDFAAVKQQLQKIRASTRSSKKGEGEGTGGFCPGSSRPLPPLPGGSAANKSVRFALPEGGQLPSGSEGSDQGYESDQSRVSRFLLSLNPIKPLLKLRNKSILLQKYFNTYLRDSQK